MIATARRQTISRVASLLVHFLSSRGMDPVHASKGTLHWNHLSACRDGHALLPVCTRWCWWPRLAHLDTLRRYHCGACELAVWVRAGGEGHLTDALSRIIHIDVLIASQYTRSDDGVIQEYNPVPKVGNVISGRHYGLFTCNPSQMCLPLFTCPGHQKNIFLAGSMLAVLEHACAGVAGHRGCSRKCSALPPSSSQAHGRRARATVGGYLSWFKPC